MTTALQIINRAAEIIGYKDPDEALNGNDASNFLGVLNDLVDGWRTQRLFVIATTEIVQTVSGNPITIGPAAMIDVTIRPERVANSGFFRSGNTDFGFDVIPRQAYEAFMVKTVSSPWPVYCYYEKTYPTGSLYFYPALSASAELHLPSDQVLAQFADLSTNYSLAPAYKNALQYSLAEELAPGRRPLDPQVQMLAMRYRGAIETFEPGLLKTGFERRQGNILTGWNG